MRTNEEYYKYFGETLEVNKLKTMKYVIVKILKTGGRRMNIPTASWSKKGEIVELSEDWLEG